ncbi:MAG TPA: LysM peptidoglycan-binding domain-containing protein, partial [Longimicrobiaceae bacterium]|nr:LysM peptidoglycan-binding domain-containing protein [Longimicrobiaceae bacterium]
NQWVQSELDFLVNQRHDVIGGWLQRADYYQPWVKEVFGAAGVPLDLSHLAMVESGYTPGARSRVGAVGMWQFMAGTGRGMGLRVDEIVDERMDPVRSTRAAARHLRDLNQAFNGDWALAIAAYNAGTGRISRGLRTYNVTNFWDLAQAGNLAEETRRYVPRLYAVTVIAHEPARFGYAPPAGPVRRFAFDSVRVDVMTPLSQLAETGGVPLGDLLELNPHLVRGTAPAEYWVWTPKGTGEAVQQAFNTSEFRRSGGYGYYVVRSGDDLGKLATAAGLSVEQVRAMNPRMDAAAMTRGQRLVFPVGVATMLASRPVERVAVAEPERSGGRRGSSNGANGNGNNRATGNSADSGDDQASDDSPRTSRASRTASADRANADAAGERTSRSRGTDAEPERPARSTREEARPRTFEHTVKRGETVQSLAERFDVPPSRIRSLNELEVGTRLRPGRVLRIPRPADEQSASTERTTTRSSTADAPRPFVHTVKRGETLASLAERFDVTPARIRALNDLEAGARLRPGREIRIPRNAEPGTARGTSESESRTSTRTASSTRASDSDDSDAPARTSRTAGGSESRPRSFEHTVKRGETVQSLAERFDVPPSRIRALNELERDATLRPGRVIRIPRADDAQTASTSTSSRASRASSGDDSDTPARASRSASTGDAPARSTRSTDGGDGETRTSRASASREGDGESRTSRTASRDAGGSAFTHTVVRGETLQSLADRFDVPPSRIRAANDLEAGERITPGQKLRIPRAGGETASRSTSGERTASTERPSSTRRASERDGETASASRGTSSRKTGDDEGRPARTASSTRSSSERRESGEGSGTSRRSGSGEGSGSRTASPTRSGGRYTDHTVKAGETLYSLARRYSVTVAQIRNANDLEEGAALGIGRKLRIPQSAER